MKFLSITKHKVLPLISAAIIAVSSFYTNASAEFFPVNSELSQYCSDVYQKARADFGRSFNGYCGTYIRCQLKALGIFDGQYDFHANGNGWYDVFEGVSETSGGYSVLRESGGDCLEKLILKYGNNLKNIVVSFPVQANYSPQFPGAGHALLIHELKDSVAYYTESFSFGNFPEGQVIAEDISSLMMRYQRKHGTAKGCVFFSEKKKTYVCSKGPVMLPEVLSEEELVEKIIETLSSSVITLYVL